MLAKTHLAFGFLSGLMISPFVNTGNTPFFFALILIGALIPDIDQKNSKISNKTKPISRAMQLFTRHRGVFHSALAAILLSGLVWLFLSNTYGIALFIGYFSHLLIDSFTKSGINFLFPIANLRISGFIKTGKTSEFLVLLVIIALIIIKII